MLQQLQRQRLIFINGKYYFTPRLKTNKMGVLTTKRFFCSQNNINKSTQIEPISARNLRGVFLCAAIPMVGFGFIDNTIMIRVGDAIDAGLGKTKTFCQQKK